MMTDKGWGGIAVHLSLIEYSSTWMHDIREHSFWDGPHICAMVQIDQDTSKKKNIGGCLSASLFAEGYGEYRLVREKH